MAERDEFRGDAGLARASSPTPGSLDLNQAHADIPPEANGDFSHDRWALIKALFEAALSRPASERNAFLESHCAGDGELRQEVESLLSAHEETSEFLEQPFASIKSFVDNEASLASEEEFAAGTRIGAYRLEREIGQGGMGAVYLATRADSEYFKSVAIKLIPHAKVSDTAISRFRKERQILATIEHPYVARLLDGGTTGAGLPYFVMEYVEGQPLKQYCDSRSLNLRERLELFLKICAAVHYAHCRNVIHRDLKPSNILVQHDGTPKLLDFGIAKLIDPEIPGASNETTLVGFRLLTPAYASPEQMRGDPATIRSDIYSLGVVLYELLCGERPSLGAFQQDLSQAERSNDAHLPRDVRTILLKAIQWDPEERYASADAFAADIQRYLDGALPHASSRVALEDETLEQVSIAILPLREPETDTNTNAFLASGITDALITRLSRVERIAVRPTSAVLKYAEAQDTARAAKELRVKYILEGFLYITGEHVRVSVQLVSVETGTAIWGGHFDEKASDLLKLEESISEQVSHALIPQLSSEERELLSKRGTTNARAHELYLRGRWHWTRGAADTEELAKALVCFMQAIAEDPQHARAHAGVADYYLRLGLLGGLPPSESFAAAIQAAETALQLDPALAEAHASLAFALWAYHRDYAAAEQHFHLAITRNPGYASAHHWFGLLNSARNRPELAIANLERARKLDPNSAMIAAALGFVYYNARQYGRAVELLLAAARDSKNSSALYEILSWCYLKLGDNSKAREAAERSVELSSRSPASLCALAHVEAANGRREIAARLRDEIETAAGQRYVSGYDRASAFLAVGETSNALRCLEEAFDDRDWWVCWIAVDPRWDSLRHEPQFTKVVLNTQPAKAIESPSTNAIAPVRRTPYGIIGAVAATVLTLIAIAYALNWWHPAHQPVPFSSLKFTKLTSNGTASLAAISPNGKYVAYTTTEAGATEFWLRPLSSPASVRLTAPVVGEVTGLDFTRTGTEVTFVNYPSKQPSTRYLYTVPISGGPPKRLFGTFAGPVSLSLDGTREAFIKANRALQQDELWVANVNSRGERILATYKYPERFSWESRPAWSADGKLLAYALEESDRKGFFIRLVVCDTETGERHEIASPRWQWVQHISWSGGTSGLLIVGQEYESSFQQIWYLSYPKGEATRIGNDLDDYSGVSVTAIPSKLVSVQLQRLSDVYILRPNDPARSVQITPGSGRYFDLAWTPDGRLLYASDATGSADIWIMNADGRGQRQLTFGAGRSYAPVASPDGKIIAFHSNRNGNWNIWRATSDAGEPKQLTTGTRDSNWPEFTPDGNFVVYHHTNVNGGWNIWKTPLRGGSPIQLSNALTTHPAVSPKDGKIACWYSEDLDNPRWKLAVFSPEGGAPLRVFDPAPAVKPDSILRWTPSGDAITFLDGRVGNYNIWLQPIDGRPPHPLTSFTSGEIFSFAWSKDGKLAYSRGMSTSDVVLIRDTTNDK
ncbi:MAG: protein kinase domain-containing protein [Bryobacteraceae bacterium]